MNIYLLLFCTLVRLVGHLKILNSVYFLTGRSWQASRVGSREGGPRGDRDRPARQAGEDWGRGQR